MQNQEITELNKNAFIKPKNIYDPNKLSINPNENIPKLQLEIEKRDTNILAKERQKKNLLNKKLLKDKLFEKYRIIRRQKTYAKKKNEDKEDQTKKRNLKKIYYKFLKKAKKNKLNDIILLVQDGPKTDDNHLIDIKKLVTQSYDFNEEDDFDNPDDQLNEKTRVLKRNITKNIGIGIAHDHLQNYKKHNIPLEYWKTLSMLDINIGEFKKYGKTFENIKLNYSGTIEDSIISYILKHLAENNVSFKEFKPYLKKYYNFVKTNITQSKIELNELNMFIIMYQTFILNHFWMLFPRENKYFFSYLIDRIFQTIDEGAEHLIKKYDETKDTEDHSNDIIANDEERNVFNQIKILKDVQDYADSRQNPYYFYEKTREYWENSSSSAKTNKNYFILAATKNGIIRYLLVTCLHILHSSNKSRNYITPQIENKGTTQFIIYLHYNLPIILDFLYTQIDIMMKDSNMSNIDREDNFLKYLIKEYNILLEL